jgi:hypothetical protein
MTGGILSLSANGDHDSVLWAALPLDEDAFIATVRGVLRAFDATTLEEIWSTAAADPNDRFSFAKFCPLSVVNVRFTGHIFRPSQRLRTQGGGRGQACESATAATAPNTPAAQRKALSAIGPAEFEVPRRKYRHPFASSKASAVRRHQSHWARTG